MRRARKWKRRAHKGRASSLTTGSRTTAGRSARKFRPKPERRWCLHTIIRGPWRGPGTTALELLEQVPDLDALVVCIGGGGLIAGCAIAAKHLKPSIRIFGVEPANANDTYLSFAAGKRVEISAPDTIADGLRSPSPGELTFPVIQKHVEKIVLVSEDEIRATVKFLLTRMKILVEPSGAVSAAAAMFGKLPAGLGRVGIVLSGGNVDLDQLAGF